MRNSKGRNYQHLEPQFLAGVGEKDSHLIENYEQIGGYETVKKALEGSFSSKKIMDAIKKSGFCPVDNPNKKLSDKWTTVCETEEKYLVCNAGESEPGIFKDRVLLENNPHFLLEGIVLSALTVGASACFIYIRGEYELAFERLENAVEEARGKKYLGDKIFGSSLNCRVEIIRGAGRYICNTSAALLNSMEGERCIAYRNRNEIGDLYGRPVLVENPETLCGLLLIVKNSPQWYKNWGTESGLGVRLLSVSGAVKKPGVYEIPLGIPVRQLIDDYCGGVRTGDSIKAVFPGAISRPPLPADRLDTKFDSESLRAARTGIGAGIIVIPETYPMPKIALKIAYYFQNQSCGYCVSCREGLKWLTGQLKIIKSGSAHASDIELVEDICSTLNNNCFCNLGSAAATVILSIIKNWALEFQDLVSDD